MEAEAKMAERVTGSEIQATHRTHPAIFSCLQYTFILSSYFLASYEPKHYTIIHSVFTEQDLSVHDECRRNEYLQLGRCGR